jgi:hypothetical protein
LFIIVYYCLLLPWTCHSWVSHHGTRFSRWHRSKLTSVIDRIEHGHHVYALTSGMILKQCGKFSTSPRNKFCQTISKTFGLRKDLDHLDAIRCTFHMDRAAQ